MGTQALVPIGSLTLSGSASTITFNSIGNYRDYVIRGIAYNSAYTYAYLTFNTDTSTSTSAVTAFQVGGGGILHQAIDTMSFCYLGNFDGGDTAFDINIFDAQSTDKHKSVIARGSSTGRPDLSMTYARWQSTAAINSISFKINGTFNAGTTVSLYGVVA